MIEFRFEGNWAQIIMGLAGNMSSSASANVEAVISNRVKHAVIAEFGSGIYSEAKGSKKQVIKPKKAKALIIPVSQKYTAKLKAETIAEAMENGRAYPDILARLKGQMPGVVGFLFRDSMRGMKPIRMVRDSMPKVEAFLNKEIPRVLASKNRDRAFFAQIINTAAILWLREIVKRSPVLTSNMKSGWNITKYAK